MEGLLIFAKVILFATWISSFIGILFEETPPLARLLLFMVAASVMVELFYK